MVALNVPCTYVHDLLSYHLWKKEHFPTDIIVLPCFWTCTFQVPFFKWKYYGILPSLPQYSTHYVTSNHIMAPRPKPDCRKSLLVWLHCVNEGECIIPPKLTGQDFQRLQSGCSCCPALETGNNCPAHPLPSLTQSSGNPLLPAQSFTAMSETK